MLLFFRFSPAAAGSFPDKDVCRYRQGWLMLSNSFPIVRIVRDLLVAPVAKCWAARDSEGAVSLLGHSAATNPSGCDGSDKSSATDDHTACSVWQTVCLAVGVDCAALRLRPSPHVALFTGTISPDTIVPC